MAARFPRVQCHSDIRSPSAAEIPTSSIRAPVDADFMIAPAPPDGSTLSCGAAADRR